MELAVHRLREALEFLGPAVPKKHPIPVLANILLKDGQVVATDLEVAVALELPEAEGKCVVPYRPVADLLKRIPWDETLTLEYRGKSLHLAWSGGKASYEAPDTEDYPPLPEVEATVEQTVDGDTLVPALLSVADYCGSDDTRPVLSGVTLYLGDTVEIAAGDGFRMAYQPLPVSIHAEGMSTVIVPAKAVRLLGHLWDRTPRAAPLESSLIRVVTARRQLELALGNEKLQAHFGPVSFIAKLVQGTPPNFRQLIPAEDAPHRVQVLAPDLERAARSVREVAKDGSGIVRLIWSETTMTVSAKSDETETEVAVPVEAEGGPGRVALNLGYLLDYLRGRQGMVTVGVRGPQDPILFRYGASPLVLIMPMFVQW